LDGNPQFIFLFRPLDDEQSNVPIAPFVSRNMLYLGANSVHRCLVDGNSALKRIETQAARSRIVSLDGLCNCKAQNVSTFLHRYDERGEGTSLRSEVKKARVTLHQERRMGPVRGPAWMRSQKWQRTEFCLFCGGSFFHFWWIFAYFGRFRQFSGLIFPLFVLFPISKHGILARRKAC
jgi:hypothetical protein